MFNLAAPRPICSGIKTVSMWLGRGGLYTSNFILMCTFNLSLNNLLNDYSDCTAVTDSYGFVSRESNTRNQVLRYSAVLFVFFRHILRFISISSLCLSIALATDRSRFDLEWQTTFVKFPFPSLWSVCNSIPFSAWIRVILCTSAVKKKKKYVEHRLPNGECVLFS